MNGQPEVIEVVEETVVIEEVIKAKPKSPAPEAPVTVETQSAAEVKEERSLSSDSESEEEAEYHAQPPSTSVSVQLIKEEPEEEQEVKLIQQAPPTVVESPPITEAEPAEPAPAAEEEKAAAQPEEEACTDKASAATSDDSPNGHALEGEAPPTLRAVAEETEEEPHIVNGSVSRVETEHLPQVICCSEVIDIPSGDGRLRFPCASALLLISSSISHSFLLPGRRSCLICAQAAASL